MTDELRRADPNSDTALLMQTNLKLRETASDLAAARSRVCVLEMALKTIATISTQGVAYSARQVYDITQKALAGEQEMVPEDEA